MFILWLKKKKGISLNVTKTPVIKWRLVLKIELQVFIYPRYRNQGDPTIPLLNKTVLNCILMHCSILKFDLTVKGHKLKNQILCVEVVTMQQSPHQLSRRKDSHNWYEKIIGRWLIDCSLFMTAHTGRDGHVNEDTWHLINGIFLLCWFYFSSLLCIPHSVTFLPARSWGCDYFHECYYFWPVCLLFIISYQRRWGICVSHLICFTSFFCHRERPLHISLTKPQTSLKLNIIILHFSPKDHN